jgi:hypothetical protein
MNPLTVMYVTIRHLDGYEQSYAAAIPDKTPHQAYEARLAVARRGGGLLIRPDPDAFTIRLIGQFSQTEITFSGGAS